MSAENLTVNLVESHVNKLQIISLFFIVLAAQQLLKKNKLLIYHIQVNNNWSAWRKLTLGFAKVQGMVGHGHPESLSRIDVSSRVVVTLGVFDVSAFFCRCEEEEEGAAKHAEKLLLQVSVGEKLHYAVALSARSLLLPMRFNLLVRFEETFFLLLFFFIQVLHQLVSFLLHYCHLLELISSWCSPYFTILAISAAAIISYRLFLFPMLT